MVLTGTQQHCDQFSSCFSGYIHTLIAALFLRVWGGGGTGTQWSSPHIQSFSTEHNECVLEAWSCFIHSTFAKLNFLFMRWLVQRCISWCDQRDSFKLLTVKCISFVADHFVVNNLQFSSQLYKHQLEGHYKVATDMYTCL